MPRLAIVDDHPTIRSGLVALLGSEAGFEVCCDCRHGRELIEWLEDAQKPAPQIVLMDLDMPVLDGLQCTQWLQEHRPDVHVIIFSMHSDGKYIVHLMDQGARGYLLKDAEPDEIINAIHSVADTGYYFSELVSRSMLAGLAKREKVVPSFKPGADISEREREVLDHICRELTTKEIADKLFISARTVEGHRNRLLEKTGARNTAGLVVFAIKHGFFDAN